MGLFKNLDLVFHNYFPNEEDYDKLFHEFYEWLNDDEKNMMFVPSNKIGYYLDLCNNEEISISECCEYWCKFKLNIHNGKEGFVIKQ